MKVIKYTCEVRVAGAKQYKHAYTYDAITNTEKRCGDCEAHELPYSISSYITESYIDSVHACMRECPGYPKKPRTKINYDGTYNYIITVRVRDEDGRVKEYNRFTYVITR